MMRCWGFAISLLLGCSMMAQEPSYSFIDYAKSRILFGGDSSAFMRFYQKLDSFENRKKKVLRVAHIGGSHVQGGIWSNSFLVGLQSELKAAGGGYFVFPYRIAKTNAPPFSSSFSTGSWKRCRCVSRELCQPLGMSGWSVSTNDSAAVFGFALTKRAIVPAFNTIRVYHDFNPSFVFDISASRRASAVRLDMPALGYTQFDLAEAVDSISFDLLKQDTLQKNFTLFGFSVESNLANNLYLATLGANGASSGSFLRCSHFLPQLKTISPDLVIVSLGVNDTQSKDFSTAAYIANYDSLIIQIRQASPEAAILLTTTTDNFIKRRTANKRPQAAREAMLELMKKHNTGVWDLYEVMGGYKSIVNWVKGGLAAKDRVHFSPRGYTVLGHLMSKALIDSYRYNQKIKAK